MSFLTSDETQEVTFLYKLQNGTSPDSYGMNVARMAEIPKAIVDFAQSISEEFSRIQEEKRALVNGVGLTRIAIFKMLMEDGINEEMIMRIWKSLQPCS
jgi:DNA mismatch repair protein MSH6